VFTIATMAAYIGVNGKLAACAFMMALQNKPLPRIKFSSNSSGTIILILATLHLLIMPCMDFFSASHAIRWNSGLDLSVIAACIALRRAGGI
jgi:hypothetical protein